MPSHLTYKYKYNRCQSWSTLHLADLLMDQMLQIEFQVLLSAINMCFCLLLERRFGRIVMSDSLLALKERDDNFLYLCRYGYKQLQHLASSQGMYVTIMCGYNVRY